MDVIDLDTDTYKEIGSLTVRLYNDTVMLFGTFSIIRSEIVNYYQENLFMLRFYNRTQFFFHRTDSTHRNPALPQYLNLTQYKNQLRYTSNSNLFNRWIKKPCLSLLVKISPKNYYMSQPESTHRLYTFELEKNNTVMTIQYNSRIIKLSSQGVLLPSH